MRLGFALLAVAGALVVGMNAGCAIDPYLKSSDHYFTTPETAAAARAIRRGNARGLERMIARGLDVSARGREGMDLLKWSMGRFCLECFETLLERGADIERPPAGEYTGKIEQLWLMPVMELAAIFNNPAYLAALLRHGGDPNAFGVYGSVQIINEAIMHHRMENIRLLVEAGADINARARGSLRTPLHTAVMINQYEIAYYLLEQGANPMLRDKTGDSVIDDIKMWGPPGVEGSEVRDWFLQVVDRLGLDREEVMVPRSLMMRARPQP